MRHERIPSGVYVAGRVELYKHIGGVERLITTGELLKPLELGHGCVICGDNGWITTAIQTIDVYQHKIQFTTLNSAYVLYGEV